MAVGWKNTFQTSACIQINDLEGLLKHWASWASEFYSVHLRWDSRICLSSKFPAMLMLLIQGPTVVSVIKVENPEKEHVWWGQGSSEYEEVHWSTYQTWHSYWTSMNSYIFLEMKREKWVRNTDVRIISIYMIIKAMKMNMISQGQWVLGEVDKILEEHKI